MQNIEIKSPLANRADVERRLRALGAEDRGTWRQRDTFFETTRPGWLKMREVEGKPAELIAYLRATDETGPRASEYDIVRHDDGDLVRRALSRVLGVRGVVEKERTLWQWRHTRVHLDRVERLGEFLELETVLAGIERDEGQRETDEAIDALGLERSRFLAVPYLEMLRAQSTQS